ncbi:hypothetical protein BJ742DRAFT_540153 [Cladochytrium replicatum]|nr:hypothetical protein BJ742DRAFT_540153 [Cladochytrium replicatum]
MNSSDSVVVVVGPSGETAVHRLPAHSRRSCSLLRSFLLIVAIVTGAFLVLSPGTSTSSIELQPGEQRLLHAWDGYYESLTVDGGARSFYFQRKPVMESVKWPTLLAQISFKDADFQILRQNLFPDSEVSISWRMWPGDEITMYAFRTEGAVAVYLRTGTIISPALIDTASGNSGTLTFVTSRPGIQREPLTAEAFFIIIVPTPGRSSSGGGLASVNVRARMYGITNPAPVSQCKENAKACKMETKKLSSSSWWWPSTGFVMLEAPLGAKSAIATVHFKPRDGVAVLLTVWARWIVLAFCLSAVVSSCCCCCGVGRRSKVAYFADSLPEEAEPLVYRPLGYDGRRGGSSRQNEGRGPPPAYSG